MILHTINKPSALKLCEHLIGETDQVVLIEEGVYLAAHRLRGEVSALAVDVVARGCAAIMGDTPQINYDDFVTLCARADKVCAWF